MSDVSGGRDTAGRRGTNDMSTTGIPDEATAAPGVPTRKEELQHQVHGSRQGMFGVRGSGDTSGYGGLVTTIAVPGGSEPPYGGWFDDVARALSGGLSERGLPDAVEKVVVDPMRRSRASTPRCSSAAGSAPVRPW